jgi:hypothetical protein
VLWRPFDKPILNLSIEDLERLRDDGTEESLFLEYKSQWSGHQIAKSVDGFANTEGGTLVVGMTTRGRKPVELVGLEHSGDLGESLDQVVRSSIAPRPDFRFTVIDNREGRPCLVVETPRGPSRPYLVTTTGQVMRRTQTATEPATRDYLDRLFLEGRAGEGWARRIAVSELANWSAMPEAGLVWTIPGVEEGLSLGTRLFTQPFLDHLLEVADGFPWVSRFGGGHKRPSVTDSYLMVSKVDPFDGSEFNLRAGITGMVKSVFNSEHMGSGEDTLGKMIDSALPFHKSLLVDSFGFRGKVIVALRNRWPRSTGSGETRYIALTHPDFVLADDLDTQELAESLKRQMARSLGYWQPEPTA